MGGDRQYSSLPGGVLEALGRLFSGPVKLYVYPRKNSEHAPLMTLENMPVPDNMKPLHSYFQINHLVEDLRGINPDNLKIHYSDLLKMIRSNDPTWETMVPPAVAQLIKDGKLFGYGGGNEE